jgi:diphthamide biosynthesis methyltransferase
MASLTAEGSTDLLWALIESRDRAFAGAHDLFHRQINDKEEKIKALTGANQILQAQLSEKEAEIAQKEAEICSVTEAGAARQVIIDEIKASKEYKLGLTLLHPWAVLKSLL